MRETRKRRRQTSCAPPRHTLRWRGRHTSLACYDLTELVQVRRLGAAWVNAHVANQDVLCQLPVFVGLERSRIRVTDAIGDLDRLDNAIWVAVEVPPQT